MFNSMEEEGVQPDLVRQVIPRVIPRVIPTAWRRFSIPIPPQRVGLSVTSRPEFPGGGHHAVTEGSC